MSGVLVVVDCTGPTLNAVSLETAAAGAVLARALNEPLVGGVIGAASQAAAQDLLGGFCRIYAVQDERFGAYVAHRFVAAARALIAECKPSVVLFAHTSQTREWVPRLAASLDAGLVTDCTAFNVEHGKLISTKPVYGGGAIGEFEIRGSVRLATVRAGVFEPASTGACAEIVRLDIAIEDDERVTLVDHVAAASTAGPNLKDAKVVIAGGRGIGGAQDWHYIDEVAAALGAAVGCSRPVADAGWVPSMHQVGLSGTCVSPDLYIAVGISGAVQHLAGIAAAKTVVAINTDGDADIISRADYAVVADYRDVLPAFIERVKQLRA